MRMRVDSGVNAQVTGSTGVGCTRRSPLLNPPPRLRSESPVLLALHGKGGNHTDAFAALDLPGARGDLPLAVLSVDGGGTYSTVAVTVSTPAPRSRASCCRGSRPRG